MIKWFLSSWIWTCNSWTWTSNSWILTCTLEFQLVLLRFQLVTDNLWLVFYHNTQNNFFVSKTKNSIFSSIASISMIVLYLNLLKMQSLKLQLRWENGFLIFFAVILWYSPCWINEILSFGKWNEWWKKWKKKVIKP